MPTRDMPAWLPTRPTTARIELDGIAIDVVRKNVRNLNLRVRSPDGGVRISAPRRTSLRAIRAFATSRLDWIRRQQATMRAREREPPRAYVTGETHHFWGRGYLLKVTESDQPPSVALNGRRMLLQVRPRSRTEARGAVVAKWLREQLKQAVPPLVSRWEPRMGVEVRRFYVRRMKTLWGSCNTRARTIRLNTELARRPPACLEYIVVHEMVHLLEPSHNARFVALMDTFLPGWREQRDELKRAPIAREGWGC